MTETTTTLNPQSIRRKLEACGCETQTVGSYDDMGGNKVYILRCTIDAPSATKLLESYGNPNNRNILKSNVTKLVHDMDNGRWEDNADTIVMDANLMFKNGHHRLNALTQSDATIAFTLAVGVSSDLYDVGKPRTVKDQMKMSGADPELTKKTPSIMVAWYLRQGRSDKRVRLTGRFSNAEIIDGMADMYETISSLHEIVAGPENRHLARPQLVGTLAFAALTEPEKAVEFLTALRSMENLQKGSPILWLSKKLNSTSTTLSGTQREHLVLDVLFAFNAYCNGEEVTKAPSKKAWLAAYDRFAKTEGALVVSLEEDEPKDVEETEED